jgi:hypothetical protein
MSKTTLRKRIALTATTALFAGMLSVATAPVTQAAVHVAAGQANPVLSGSGDLDLFVATEANTGGGAVVSPVGIGGAAAVVTTARSTGLLSKDTSTGTAQTVTMLAGGTLSLYANATTSTAFAATAGTFSSATGSAFAGEFKAATYGDPANKVFLEGGTASHTATGIAVLWTSPSTVGTYTISKYYSTNSGKPTLATPSGGTLGSQITVTVVAASAGGSYSAAQSGCYTRTASSDGTTVNAGTYTADSTSSFVVNGAQWYIGFALNDAYGQNLAAGSLVATATNGGIINLSSTGDGSALAAGTASTVVAAGTGQSGLVRIDQPTAGAPLTTTVTVTYNGTVVCTKTVSIAGAAASITISDVATVDLGGNSAIAGWLNDTFTSGAASGRNGHYYITLKDSAGNNVTPASSAEFSMDPATTTTTVTALAVNSSVATATSSTDPFSKSVGTFTCGPVAGSSNVKLRHTSASTGVTISSPAFAARCADDPWTYTASWDKASYVQGEIATLTVKFLDSKGNAANSLDTPGAVTMVAPMLTAVTTTGSATMLPKADGTKAYTFTVGLPGGITAGTYTSIIDFTGLTGVAATVQTPTYKVGTGGDTTSNADILKSIVALIASINKQIQALQKLILRR